jgi:hypothetical protein
MLRHLETSRYSTAYSSDRGSGGEGESRGVGPSRQRRRRVNSCTVLSEQRVTSRSATSNRRSRLSRCDSAKAVGPEAVAQLQNAVPRVDIRHGSPVRE